MNQFNRKQLFCLLFGLILLCTAGLSWAATPQAYQIEVIVFSHFTKEGLKSEYWSMTPNWMTIPPNTIELSEDQILPKDRWVLKGIENRLKNNQSKVLLHLAWREDTAAARRGQRVHLYGGTIYQDGQRELNGTFSIQLQRYFDIKLNLHFLVPISAIGYFNRSTIIRDDQSNYVNFNINQKLRMRSQELNYVDHPLYGVLIQITPLAMIADDENDDTQ